MIYIETLGLHLIIFRTLHQPGYALRLRRMGGSPAARAELRSQRHHGDFTTFRVLKSS